MLGATQCVHFTPKRAAVRCWRFCCCCLADRSRNAPQDRNEKLLDAAYRGRTDIALALIEIGTKVNHKVNSFLPRFMRLDWTGTAPLLR